MSAWASSRSVPADCGLDSRFGGRGRLHERRTVKWVIGLMSRRFDYLTAGLRRNGHGNPLKSSPIVLALVHEGKPPWNRSWNVWSMTIV